MSKFYDALKRAAWTRVQSKIPETPAADVPRVPDRRRSPRIYVEIPLFVYGYSAGDVPFHEEARTLAINTHGGVLSMQSGVQIGQQLLLTNPGNGQIGECRVLFVSLRAWYGHAVAFSFAAFLPDFWRALEIGGTTEP